MIWHLPTMSYVSAERPITATDLMGRVVTGPANWWQTTYPAAWRTLLAAAGYAPGIDEAPAPHGLGPPVLEADADGLPLVRRAALPAPAGRVGAAVSEPHCLDPRPIAAECCGTCRYWGGPIWVRPGILYPCARAEAIAQSMASTSPLALAAVSMEYRDGDGCPIHAQTEPGRDRSVCRTPREDDA